MGEREKKMEARLKLIRKLAEEALDEHTLSRAITMAYHPPEYMLRTLRDIADFAESALRNGGEK